MTVCKKAGPAILRLIFSVYMVAQVKPGLPRVKRREKAGFSRVKMRKKAGFSRRGRGGIMRAKPEKEVMGCAVVSLRRKLHEPM